MTDRLSSTDGSRQQAGQQEPQAKPQGVAPDILHFPMDLHAEVVEYPPGMIDGARNPDDDDFDHDADTVTDNGDDDPPPAGAAAVGLPCMRGQSRADRSVYAYSLSAVLILPDPGYPKDTDDPDYLADGQEMMRFTTLDAAQNAADDYAAYPEKLPLIEVAAVTHLVVNYHNGTEMYRAPIRPARIAA